ncbi:MAG: acyl-CoA dehydratase activase [Deltaproteobacteria bacterium]
MITAGIDIGSLSANVVVLSDAGIVASHTIRTGADSVGAAWRVMREAIELADSEAEGLSLEDVDYIVATGYGRVIVPFSNSTVTEIACHARGNNWVFPEVRTILDMGGQDCKAIRCDGNGKVITFEMNDKCAAGTGRYLERAASTLGIKLREFGELALQTEEGAAIISSMCTVYAQRDILLLRQQGVHRNDILAGACKAIVERIFPMLSRIGIQEAFVVSGGVANNIGVIRCLEEKVGMEAQKHSDPQIIGALGAALFARDKMKNTNHE